MRGSCEVGAYREPGLGYEDAGAVHRAVTECVRVAGVELADWVRPGETVLLKPNWVKAEHPRLSDGWRTVMTGTPVVEAMAREVWKAMDGRGRIVVADAPQTDSSFAAIEACLGLRAMESRLRAQGIGVSVVDLRKEEWVQRDGVIAERRQLAGDPAGYVAFDLAQASEFAEHTGGGRYYGADYDAGEVNRHHTGGRHEYLLARSAVEADVVISIPKLKTHKKTGITAGLKNLVGVNGDKNWLPHHTEFGWGAAGDERPRGDWKMRLERSAARGLRKLNRMVPGLGPLVHGRAHVMGAALFGETEQVVRSGNWHGNDTCWRMCLDLNKLVIYGRPDGTLGRERRRYLVLADGLVAGEGAGPMNPDPVAAGLLLFGTDAASVDAAAATLMGFDAARIPLVRLAFQTRGHAVSVGRDWREVRLRSNVAEWEGRRLPEVEETFHFKPHFGWRGMIERSEIRVAA
jgi:uncharacterized protein (DUF362 family)